STTCVSSRWKTQASMRLAFMASATAPIPNSTSSTPQPMSAPRPQPGARSGRGAGAKGSGSGGRGACGSLIGDGVYGGVRPRATGVPSSAPNPATTRHYNPSSMDYEPLPEAPAGPPPLVEQTP